MVILLECNHLRMYAVCWLLRHFWWMNTLAQTIHFNIAFNLFGRMWLIRTTTTTTAPPPPRPPPPPTTVSKCHRSLFQASASLMQPPPKRLRAPRWPRSWTISIRNIVTRFKAIMSQIQWFCWDVMMYPQINQVFAFFFLNRVEERYAQQGKEFIQTMVGINKRSNARDYFNSKYIFQALIFRGHSFVFWWEMHVLDWVPQLPEYHWTNVVGGHCMSLYVIAVVVVVVVVAVASQKWC